MRHTDDDMTVSRTRKIASGAVASAAVIAANLLVVNAEAAAGQNFYDLAAERTATTFSVAIPSAPAPVDAARVAAPELPDLESLDDVGFVVPVLERREAVLPEPPELDGAPWIKNGIPPAPRAGLDVAAPTVEDVPAFDEIRIEVPELRLPESAAAVSPGR